MENHQNQLRFPMKVCGVQDRVEGEARRGKGRKRKEQGDAGHKQTKKRAVQEDTTGEHTGTGIQGPHAAHMNKLRDGSITCLPLPGCESMNSIAGNVRTAPYEGAQEAPRKRSRIYTRRNKKKPENDINIDEIFNIVNVQGPCTSLVISHDECLHNLWAVYRQEFPCGHEFMEFTAQIPNK